MTTSAEVAATTPEVLASEFSLLTAVTRLDFLSRRDNVVVDEPNDSTDDDDWMRIKDVTTSLDVDEALELLALGEVVARKAHEHRQLGIRAALRGGADWDQIARALSTSPRTAWVGHLSWLDQQAAARRAGDADALDEEAVAASRQLAGRRP